MMRGLGVHHQVLRITMDVCTGGMHVRMYARCRGEAGDTRYQVRTMHPTGSHTAQLPGFLRPVELTTLDRFRVFVLDISILSQNANSKLDTSYQDCRLTNITGCYPLLRIKYLKMASAKGSEATTGMHFVSQTDPCTAQNRVSKKIPLELTT